MRCQRNHLSRVNSSKIYGTDAKVISPEELYTGYDKPAKKSSFKLKEIKTEKFVEEYELI